MSPQTEKTMSCMGVSSRQVLLVHQRNHLRGVCPRQLEREDEKLSKVYGIDKSDTLSITPDMIRLSVGIESPEDICEDLGQALDRL